MDLFTSELTLFLKEKVIVPLLGENYPEAALSLRSLIKELHASIPEKKRISFGIYSVIKLAGEALYASLEAQSPPEKVLRMALGLFEYGDNDEHYYQSKGAALNALSLCAYHEQGFLNKVLEVFTAAAISDYWDLREYASGYCRKLTKQYPEIMHAYFIEQTRSSNPNLRRWVSESLRPVSENSWLQKKPDYSLSILENLFTESNAYPRTSVGNHLSDLARGNPELIFGLVEKLARSGNKNSYWIAYRACRNLVKSAPLRVMDLLHTDEYSYKNRKHRRADCL